MTISICERVREVYGDQKDIWSWTGYTWEEILRGSEDKLALLELVDVLVDGRFVLEQFSYDLDFRGSSNQRIIDVQKSLAEEEVVLWNEGNYK